MERLAYSRQFNSNGATVARAVGQGLAQGFYYPGSDATVGYVYVFTKHNDNINVSVSIRAVDGDDMPILPDLVVTSINLADGVLVGNDYGETNPVYRHTATLPLSISDGVHYAIVLLPTNGTVTHWLTFRTTEWDLGQYEKDESSSNWVNRWRYTQDGVTWILGGAPTSWMNFEVYGEEAAPPAAGFGGNPSDVLVKNALI